MSEDKKKELSEEEKAVLSENIEKLKSVDVSGLSINDEFRNVYIFDNPDEARIFAGRFEKQNDNVLYCELNSGYSNNKGDFITVTPVYMETKEQKLKQFPEHMLKAILIQVMEENMTLDNKLAELNKNNKG